MSAVVGLAVGAGSEPAAVTFRATRRSRFVTLGAAAYVLLTGAATFTRSLEPAHIGSLSEGAAAVGMVLPMTFAAVALVALSVRLARIRVDADGVRWGWSAAGFTMRAARVAALRLYDDAVAVQPRRGSTWYLSRRDYGPFPELLAACRRSGMPCAEEGRRAPLRARLQGYGRALDALVLLDVLLSTLVFLQ